ncbi:MAG: DUF1559 domain-containing protein, partial [Planctomycetaceae bacterium]|nr:DUF1559 domain-containing protein [Planctomycetaceae bacterium]
PDTNTLYSWRVEILPFLGHSDLYEKYRKDLPWDSPENQTLLQSIPPVYRDSAAESDTNTHCLALTGPGTFFENDGGVSFEEAESKGLFAVPALVAASTQIPWTKPDDLVVGKTFELVTPEFDDGQIQLASLLGTVANVDRSTFIAGKGKKLVDSSWTATLNWIGNYQGRKGLDYIGKLEILPNVEYLASELQQKAFRDLSHRLPYQYQSLIERSSGISYASLILLQSAMNQYLRDHGRYPSPVTQDTPEAPLRSWRVELLPYLGHHALYDRYRKNEPWDSPENAKLLDEMPLVFNNSNVPSTETPYTVIVGPGTIFNGTVGKSLEEIKDGIASTIFIVETGRKVPWTKPEDLEFDQNGAPPFLASVINKYVRFTTGDLNVHSVNNLIPPDVLKKMALCADDPDGTFQKLEVSILTLSLGDAYLKMGAIAPLVSTTASQSNPDPNVKTSLPAATNQAADPEIKNLPKTPDVPQVEELSADDHQKETVRLTDALKDAILALEEGDITRFYESYAPLAELEEMKNRGILKSEKVPFLPRESQQWLTTLKGFQGIVPQVAPDGKSALIPLASGEKSDAEEQQAPPRQRQIEPNSGPGFGDRIHVVLAIAIAALETKDYSAFVEKIYPAGELLRLELDGQKQPLIDRLKNKPELVQQ